MNTTEHDNTFFVDNWKPRLKKSTREKSKQATWVKASKQLIQKTDVPVQKPSKCLTCDKLNVCQLVEQGCTDICRY
ncbi:hypothetical protein [Methanolobus sp.]|uniref:hypothetical protein n=1 Tax=Methanolobus sp. TaxID=1874737 RepID=UPI0025D138D9|nr:hypothetical protein [Methanolobus sp.]